MKQIAIAFITKKLKDDLELLKEGKSEDKQIYFNVLKALEAIKQKPDCGIKVPRYLWPKLYIKLYEITNLWKYNLPKGWRFMYTIENDDDKILCIILEWLSHPDYEKRFKY